MYSVKEIAEAILSFQSMTHKKLQKIFYYVYVWYYIVFENRICEEGFEAWIHGPVSPELYQDYKRYGWNNIGKYFGEIKIDKYKLDFISDIIRIYGSYNAEQLELLTHSEFPWKKTRKGLGIFEYSDNYIDDDDIKLFYPMNNKDIYDYLKSVYTN